MTIRKRTEAPNSADLETPKSDIPRDIADRAVLYNDSPTLYLPHRDTPRLPLYWPDNFRNVKGTVTLISFLSNS